MTSIYQEVLLEHYKNPKNNKHLKKYSSKISVSNSLCGDDITIEVLWEKGKVKEIGFTGQGCVISQASASMLTEKVKKMNKNQLRKLDANYIIKMLGINLGPNRLKCALLPMEALKKL